MPLGTGAKVAIGCAVVAILGALVAVAVIGVGAFWLKGKAEEVAGGSLEALGAKSEEIEKWTEKANAHSFTAPADGVIAESRLVKFLEVRKAVYGVYEQNRARFESLGARAKDQETADFSDALAATGAMAGLISDVRLAQMKGLAEVGMNEEEYRFIQMAVYKSSWASAAEKESGQLPADQMREALEQAPPEARAAMESAMEQGAALVDVPRANVELFRRYQADIEKYAMHGLALVGL